MDADHFDKIRRETIHVFAMVPADAEEAKLEQLMQEINQVHEDQVGA